MIYTVLLEDGTVGTVSGDTLYIPITDALIGEVFSVHLRDENGNPIERQGRLAEVLGVSGQ